MNKFLTFLTAVILSAGHLLAAPTISSFTPKFGQSGVHVITIKGSGFTQGALIVRFNGVRDLTAGVINDTTIQAQVPAQATNGPSPIFVSIGGQGVLSADDFTVIGTGPYISDFTPNIGDAGATITLNGANMISITAVRFNGVPVTQYVNTSSANQIQVKVPTNATSGRVSISTTAGSYTNKANFYVPPKGNLTFTNGIGLTNGVWRAGTNVALIGTNLLGATLVRFGDVDAASYSNDSNFRITAMVPPGVASGTIRVSTPAGTVISTNQFFIAPTLSSFSPHSGAVGTAVALNGTVLNLTNTVVRFNGTNATIVTNISSGQITAVVPPGATSGFITISNRAGMDITAEKFYMPPVITGLSTNMGGPGTFVVISGTNFIDAQAVTFNGIPAAGFYVTNNNTLGAFAPVGYTTGPIIIVTPGGSVSSNNQLFYDAPVIFNFNPTHGLPGTNVVISGQNFVGTTSVLFGRVAAGYSVQNNTTITATVPANAQTGRITVVAPAGTNVSAQDFVLDYSANLVVTVQESADPITVGSNLVLTISVVNLGPFGVPGVTFTDTLVGPAILKGATTTRGTLNTNVFPLTGDLGALGVNQTATITLTIQAESEGTITNTATAASGYSDPIPGNNTVTTTTYVQPLAVLSVRRLNATLVRVSWSAALTNYGLQYKPFLGATNTWSNVLTLPALLGSELQVTETNSEAMRFYRLYQLP